MTLFFVISLSETIVDYSVASMILIIGVAFFIALFLFFNIHYRRFTWYKSGKIGFTGLTVAGLFFLTRSLVAMSDLDVLSFAKDMEVVVSGVVSFACFIAVYNLSRKS